MKYFAHRPRDILYEIASKNSSQYILRYENFLAGDQPIGEGPRHEIRRTKHAVKKNRREATGVVRSGSEGREREEVTSRESNEPRLAAIRRSNRAILMNSSHQRSARPRRAATRTHRNSFFSASLLERQREKEGGDTNFQQNFKNIKIMYYTYLPYNLFRRALKRTFFYAV